MVRTPPVEFKGNTHEFVPLLAHPLPQFRLRTILDMYELVVEALDNRYSPQRVPVRDVERA